MSILETLGRLGQTSGFYMLFSDWRQILMIAIACVLLYLGLVKVGLHDYVCATIRRVSWTL